MKNREIYNKALHLLSQSTSADENEDYLERAPYFLASFCTEAFEVDKLLRKSLGERPAPNFQKVYLPLESDFPLLDRLAPAACNYLAAMLVLDEDGDLSDKLYDRYCDGLLSIRYEIPATIESIADEYFPLY